MSNLSVLTYNVGRGPEEVELRTGKRPSEDEYKRVERVMNERLPSLADVWCLQEVYDKDRLIMKGFGRRTGHWKCPWRVTTPDFYVATSPDTQRPSCAVVLSTKRFTNITNISGVINGNADYAAVQAEDTVTHNKWVFVSLHAEGFGLLEHSVDPRSSSEGGDHYCRSVVKKLIPYFTTHSILVGADMNCRPENCAARFEPFKRRDFGLIRSHGTTQITAGHAYSQRELDFMFVRHPGKTRVLPMDFGDMPHSRGIPFADEHHLSECKDEHVPVSDVAIVRNIDPWKDNPSDHAHMCVLLTHSKLVPQMSESGELLAMVPAYNPWHVDGSWPDTKPVMSWPNTQKSRDANETK